MDKEKLLIVDDEDGIREMLKEYLSPEGFSIDEASDGQEALELFMKSKYSAVVLDIMMPKMDGWTVLREIRRNSQTPVIVLSARGEEYDKLFGFELGVDDYIIKPFSPRELMARIKAVIRRSKSFGYDILIGSGAEFEDLKINYESRKVTINGISITLTPKEYELLSFFSKNPNKVFSREQLLNEVWGYAFYGDYRTVDTHIKMLRESLCEYRRLIVTIWGTGYMFEAGEDK